jgi:acyl carrier protein
MAGVHGSQADDVARQGEPATMTTSDDTAALEIIREQLRDFIWRSFFFGDAVPDFADDTSLLAEGVVDETGVLELVLFVEETYGMQVAAADLIPEHFDSVNSIAGYVAAHLAEE